MMTITSSNDEYAVTLNATPHGEYIKIEVQASRGWDGNCSYGFCKPSGQTHSMRRAAEV